MPGKSCLALPTKTSFGKSERVYVKPLPFVSKLKLPDKAIADRTGQLLLAYNYTENQQLNQVPEINGGML